MASNAVLNRKAEEAMQVARLLAAFTDRTEYVYGEARYATGSWSRERRIIIKAEVVCADDKDSKDNPRFATTYMKQTPKRLYEIDLLPACRNRKPDQGTTCHGDRPHQLQPLLGQPVTSIVDCRRLCADAGTAPNCRWHQLRKGAGLDTAETISETVCAGDGLGAAHGCASAAIVSVSGNLPALGAERGSSSWIERHRLTERHSDHPDIPGYT